MFPNRELKQQQRRSVHQWHNCSDHPRSFNALPVICVFCLVTPPFSCTDPDSGGGPVSSGFQQVQQADRYGVGGLGPGALQHVSAMNCAALVAAACAGDKFQFDFYVPESMAPVASGIGCQGQLFCLIVLCETVIVFSYSLA